MIEGGINICLLSLSSQRWKARRTLTWIQMWKQFSLSRQWKVEKFFVMNNWGLVGEVSDFCLFKLLWLLRVLRLSSLLINLPEQRQKTLNKDFPFIESFRVLEQPHKSFHEMFSTPTGEKTFVILLPRRVMFQLINVCMPECVCVCACVAWRNILQLLCLVAQSWCQTQGSEWRLLFH